MIGVAFGGRPEHEYRSLARNAHLRMRDAYLPMISKVGRSIYPVIVSFDNDVDEPGQGGILLFRRREGETYRSKPTPHVYETLKSVAHVPLGIATAVLPVSRRDSGHPTAIVTPPSQPTVDEQS